MGAFISKLVEAQIASLLRKFEKRRYVKVGAVQVAH